MSANININLFSFPQPPPPARIFLKQNVDFSGEIVPRTDEETSRLLDEQEKEEKTSRLCVGQSGQRRQDDRKRRRRGGKSRRRPVKTWKIASPDDTPSKGELVFTFLYTKTCCKV
jgi:hypothetical protein